MSVAHNVDSKLRTEDVHIDEQINFAELLLSDAVLDGLTKAGFKKPSPIQLRAIPIGRCGLDLIVQAKSGTGKTCVFSVIALEGIDVVSHASQVLVLAPTREIAIQISNVIQTIGSSMEGLKVSVFIGGIPLSQDKAEAKRCHIAVGTPGRIKQLIELGILKANSIRLFILDEADKLLDEDFSETINWIYSTLPGNKQILALSATYPEYLATQLTEYMRNPTFVRLNISDPALLGIKQYHHLVPHHHLPNKIFDYKIEAVLNILSSVDFQQCLLFSNQQSRAQNLQTELQAHEWPAACIAGCLDQKERNFAMDQLKKYQCRILISTDLTSRGIDADKVNLVINLDVPKDHETYLHRIGRAGRFGSYGAAISIVSKNGEDKELWAVERKCKTQIIELPDPIPKDLALRKIAVKLSDVVTTEKIMTRPYDGRELWPALDPVQSDKCQSTGDSVSQLSHGPVMTNGRELQGQRDTTPESSFCPNEIENTDFGTISIDSSHGCNHSGHQFERGEREDIFKTSENDVRVGEDRDCSSPMLDSGQNGDDKKEVELGMKEESIVSSHKRPDKLDCEVSKKKVVQTADFMENSGKGVDVKTTNNKCTKNESRMMEMDVEAMDDKSTTTKNSASIRNSSHTNAESLKSNTDICAKERQVDKCEVLKENCGVKKLNLKSSTNYSLFSSSSVLDELNDLLELAHTASDETFLPARSRGQCDDEDWREKNPSRLQSGNKEDRNRFSSNRMKGKQSSRFDTKRTPQEHERVVKSDNESARVSCKENSEVDKSNNYSAAEREDGTSARDSVEQNTNCFQAAPSIFNAFPESTDDSLNSRDSPTFNSANSNTTDRWNMSLVVKTSAAHLKVKKKEPFQSKADIPQSSGVQHTASSHSLTSSNVERIERREELSMGEKTTGQISDGQDRDREMEARQSTFDKVELLTEENSATNTMNLSALSSLNTLILSPETLTRDQSVSAIQESFYECFSQVKGSCSSNTDTIDVVTLPIQSLSPDGLSDVRCICDDELSSLINLKAKLVESIETARQNREREDSAAMCLPHIESERGSIGTEEFDIQEKKMERKILKPSKKVKTCGEKLKNVVLDVGKTESVDGRLKVEEDVSGRDEAVSSELDQNVSVSVDNVEEYNNKKILCSGNTFNKNEQAKVEQADSETFTSQKLSSMTISTAAVENDSRNIKSPMKEVQSNQTKQKSIKVGQYPRPETQKTSAKTTGYKASLPQPKTSTHGSKVNLVANNACEKKGAINNVKQSPRPETQRTSVKNTRHETALPQPKASTHGSKGNFVTDDAFDRKCAMNGVRQNPRPETQKTSAKTTGYKAALPQPKASTHGSKVNLVTSSACEKKGAINDVGQSPRPEAQRTSVKNTRHETALPQPKASTHNSKVSFVTDDDFERKGTKTNQSILASRNGRKSSQTKAQSRRNIKEESTSDSYSTDSDSDTSSLSETSNGQFYQHHKAPYHFLSSRRKQKGRRNHNQRLFDDIYGAPPIPPDLRPPYPNPYFSPAYGYPQPTYPSNFYPPMISNGYYSYPRYPAESVNPYGFSSYHCHCPYPHGHHHHQPWLHAPHQFSPPYAFHPAHGPVPTDPTAAHAAFAAGWGDRSSVSSASHYSGYLRHMTKALKHLNKVYEVH